MVPAVANDSHSNVVGEDHLLQCSEQGCGKRFKRMANLTAHRMLHAGTKPFKCTVDGCSAAYTRKQHLTRHISLSHEKEEGLYRCLAQNCIASFETNESLYQHFRRAHYGSKLDNQMKLTCDQCNLEFPSISKLQHHTITSHSFPCSNCKRVFRLESDLKTHEVRHHTETSKSTTKCKLCDLEFDTFDALIRHRSSVEHTEKQARALTCSTCGKSFKDVGNFNYHLKIHMDDRVIHRCTHDGCDKSYYFLKNLRHHVRVIHQTESFPRPKCSICNCEFSSKHRMETHTKLMHNSDAVKTKTKRKSQLPAGEIRSRIIKTLSGKQKASGYKLLIPKRPPGLKKTILDEDSQTREAALEM